MWSLTGTEGGRREREGEKVGETRGKEVDKEKSARGSLSRGMEGDALSPHMDSEGSTSAKGHISDCDDEKGGKGTHDR
jgi:hypothetical protein